MNDQFLHTVFFWFKDPGNVSHHKMFEASILRFMNDSQFASSWHVGTPAPTNRKVVDNSYTYCLAVTFETPELQDKYQSEPAHLKFIDESQHFWDRVLVYDSIPIK